MFFVHTAIPQNHLNREIAHKFLLPLCPCIYHPWNQVKIYLQYHFGWKRRRNSSSLIGGYTRKKVSPPLPQWLQGHQDTLALASSCPIVSYTPPEHTLRVPDFQCYWGHLIALGATYIFFQFKNYVSLKKSSLWTFWNKTVYFALFWMLSKSVSGKKKTIPFCQIG